MCLQCFRFVPRATTIKTPLELYEFVGRIAPLVSRGVLKLAQSNSPLEEIRPGEPLRDHYFNVLQCARCGREYQLNVDTYHGRGLWR
jgi:hypothetical protein